MHSQQDAAFNDSYIAAHRLDRRKEISIMKYVGATNNFIRWPFIVEGMIIGIWYCVP